MTKSRPRLFPLHGKPNFLKKLCTSLCLYSRPHSLSHPSSTLCPPHSGKWLFTASTLLIPTLFLSAHLTGILAAFNVTDPSPNTLPLAPCDSARLPFHLSAPTRSSSCCSWPRGVQGCWSPARSTPAVLITHQHVGAVSRPASPAQSLPAKMSSADLGITHAGTGHPAPAPELPPVQPSPGAPHAGAYPNQPCV